MSDNTMPERITQRDARHRPVEYIRADVAQAQLDAANARIAELLALVEADAQSMDKYKAIIRQLEDNDAALHAIIGQRNRCIAELEEQYRLHRETSLADFLKQSDEHNAEIERLKSRVAFDCRQLLAERDARIAELEAALSDCRFVITELKTRLAEEGRDAINQKLIEKDYELRTTRSKLLERISMLLAEREWMPVGEGLPKMYTAVYVTVRTPQGKNDIDFAFMTQAGWSYHLSPRNGTVTHWMPLPPLPVTP